MHTILVNLQYLINLIYDSVIYARKYQSREYFFLLHTNILNIFIQFNIFSLLIPNIPKTINISTLPISHPMI